MLKVIKYLFCFFVGLYLTSCSNKHNTPIIEFSEDSTSIIINNIDEASFLQVEKIYHASPDTVNFLSVLVIPNSDDSLQMEEKIDGKIKLTKTKIIFTPKKPFSKGKSYLVENYINFKFISVNKIFKNKARINLQPQKQILTR